MSTLAERKFVASGRNGYTAVDELVRKEGSDRWLTLRLIDTYKVKHVGESVAAHMNRAYEQGGEDKP